MQQHLVLLWNKRAHAADTSAVGSPTTLCRVTPPPPVNLAGAVESGGSVRAVTASGAAAVSVLVAVKAGAAADSLRSPEVPAVEADSPLLGTGARSHILAPGPYPPQPLGADTPSRAAPGVAPLLLRAVPAPLLFSTLPPPVSCAAGRGARASASALLPRSFGSPQPLRSIVRTPPAYALLFNRSGTCGGAEDTIVEVSTRSSSPLSRARRNLAGRTTRFHQELSQR